MSSAQRIDLIKNLTLVEYPDGHGYIVNHPDIVDVNGDRIAEVRLSGSSDPSHVAYSKTVALSSRYNDYLLTATCKGCEVSVILEHSPDGINWCNCVLSNGGNCNIQCDPFVSNCTVKVIDVALLQYVRVKVSNAGNSSLDCDIFLSHSLNK